MLRINLDGIRISLKELDQHSIVFEQLGEGLFEEKLVDNHDYAKFGMTISEIMEKKGIGNKLKSMSHNTGLLRGIIQAKGHSRHQEFVSRIIENNLNCMNSIIEDLGLLKNNLDELENLNSRLLGSRLPLDIKMLLEQNFGRKHRKLNEVYAKQKELLVNLSSIFMSFARKAISGRR